MLVWAVLLEWSAGRWTGAWLLGGLAATSGALGGALALSGSVEGEATALFIGQQLSGRPVRITRLATGIPVGGHLEFVDDVTLTRAFSARLPLS
jgi:hypothetical protein